MLLKSTLKKVIPAKYHWQAYNKFKDWTTWRSKSFSQCGEDMNVAYALDNKKNGIFVDVGAFHPQKYSNTNYFYNNLNWHGINIEPNPNNFQKFVSDRKRDINLNIGISDKAGELTYFMFVDPLFNTFSVERKNDLEKQGIMCIDQKIISVKPLSQVLDEYLQNKPIDFLNVDVETLDLLVLQSIDYVKHRPKVICVEDHTFNIENPNNSEIYKFLKEKNYKLHSKCSMSSIFVSDSANEPISGQNNFKS